MSGPRGRAAAEQFPSTDCRYDVLLRESPAAGQVDAEVLCFGQVQSSGITHATGDNVVLGTLRDVGRLGITNCGHPRLLAFALL